MPLRLYNTLTRQVEAFEPLEDGRVTMYTCGPTVYDRAHIGNFRTFLAEDILRRFLRWKGYEVVQVRNLTDVDDRTIHAAVQRGVSLRELTAPFIDAFFEDHDRLGLQRAEYYPRATDYVDRMIDMVEKLVDGGFAYEADGSVYYDISRFPDYGRLAGLENIEVREGERETGDAEYAREDARDFVLWKGGERPEEGDVAVWDSPWGPGRPGWHLECSVMATAHLGQPFDIHSGGVDLIFPHHTNEIAQAEGAQGKPFARHWIHVKHMMLDGRKMSKSENHYFTVGDLLEKGSRPSAIRRLLASGHYRTEINFTLPGLEDATRSLERLLEFRRRLRDGREPEGQALDRLPQLAERALSEWEAALDDDLNLAAAWGALFTLVREANAALDEADGPVRATDADAVLDALASMDRVFGVLELADQETTEVSDDLRRWIEQQLADRAEARQQKDFSRADAIREALAEAGVEVEDTPAGPRWRLVRQS
ncbi:MAG: cysteine--tRNA ligase [Gemmatimonadetes bacterium]|uniref:Cysteine--tRNA ligase n=1 Tax=Candidatus Kutchimonas denitrificans TaxID=3056748 RepID=A0AAE4Z7R5_9BACT|nr:cysteine--tRNA ligase [Gemmatimonadota bacterium]NIR75354.1 cysteine--tRNA ligase [Candidatus Kutchimonas denitrificans]NIS00996.1 cysteine--tRNA ligase [Gemmatimonadota bacterium]NIT66620.1 cysteine--tRNA ligase [Gemmatimonadota bacterium]NIU53200.1 cysteine--tRNA ligase [Gemmatimonadota bacterium]